MPVLTEVARNLKASELSQSFQCRLRLLCFGSYDRDLPSLSPSALLTVVVLSASVFRDCRKLVQD